MFQFQLVRLKLFFIKDFAKIKGVSIPTGAIKIHLQLRVIIDILVSIPTGAIKIIMPLSAAAATVMFQFQLVRLK